MAAAVELVGIPVLLLTAIVISAIWTNLGAGAIVLGGILVLLLFASVITPLRLQWRLDEQGGTDQQEHLTSLHRKYAELAECARKDFKDAQRDVAQDCRGEDPAHP